MKRRGGLGENWSRLAMTAEATPCRMFCALNARTRINLHRHGASSSRKRFDETMAATVRRGGWHSTYLIRNWKLKVVAVLHRVPIVPLKAKSQNE